MTQLAATSRNLIRARVSPPGWRAIEDRLARLSLAAAILLGLLFGTAQAIGMVASPIDFVIYWLNNDLDHLYPNLVSDNHTPYLYPPVLAQVLAPFHVLPFEVAQVGWSVICFGSLWYCARVLTLPLVVLGFVSIWLPPDNVLGSGLEYALLGNVQLPLAAAIVAGMRHPSWFAIPIVTKLTAGVGLLWYAFRAEWRPFFIGCATVIGVVLVSFALAPSLWLEWIAFMIRNYDIPSVPPTIGPPLPVRLAAAVLLVAWGARTSRPWVVSIAGAVASPSFYGVRAFVSVAIGAWALSRDPKRPAEDPR